jgi:peptide/nickel transport system substrate-binding protein
MKRFAGLLLLISVFALIFVVACGGDEDEEEATRVPAAQPTAAPAPTSTTPPAEPTEFRMAVVADPAFLDPHRIQSGGGGGFVSDWIHNRLLKHDSTMTLPRPDLADSWTRSTDGKTIVFTLRDDVVFHTGRKFTGADIVWNWNRIINDIADKGRGRNVLSEVTSYEVTGTNEFTIKLSGDSPVILSNMPLWGLAIADSEGLAKIETEPVGTGPFTFVDFVPGAHLTVEKFPDYFDKATLAIRPDRVVMVPIEETTTRVAALKSGQVDMIVNLPLQNIEDIEDAPGLQVLEQAMQASYMTVAFNVHASNTIDEPIPAVGDPNRHPIADVRVRKAIQHTIDKEAIHNTVFLGHGDTDCNFIPEALAWAYEPLDCPKRDLAKAKELLAAAGVPDGFDVTFHPEGSPMQRQVALIVKQNLAEIGIEVEIITVDNPTWNRDVWKGGAYEMATASYAREPDPDGLMQSVFRGDSPTGPWGGNNAMGYYSPDIERLFDEGKAISDKAARKAIYLQIVKKIISSTTCR